MNAEAKADAAHRRHHKTRVHPAIHVVHASPNRSVRTAHPVLIVVHSTEGTNIPGDADLAGLGSFFGQSSVRASSHVATDADGHSAVFVRSQDKAWHCCGLNNPSLGIEQVGRAAQGSWTDAQIRETARWCARWHWVYGIPMQRGAVSGFSVTRPGILRHQDLGLIGCGHSDPGSHYPFDHMISLAHAYARRMRHNH